MYRKSEVLNLHLCSTESESNSETEPFSINFENKINLYQNLSHPLFHIIIGRFDDSPAKLVFTTSLSTPSLRSNKIQVNSASFIFDGL